MREKTTIRIPILTAFLALTLTPGLSLASDFARLDEARPSNGAIGDKRVVFDFDTDSCLPSAPISRSGQKNGGLSPTGSQTGQCRSSNFLQTSNTIHRYVCKSVGSVEYCGHMYALYFEKDQADKWGIVGHRHDWEHAIVWTQNGYLSHATVSAHGENRTLHRSQIQLEDNRRVKVVYHDNSLVNGATHSFRFAKPGETAENPYGRFVTPQIATWYEMVGDGLHNSEMRERLNGFDYGSAVTPVKDADDRFVNQMNDAKPSYYPTFTEWDAVQSHPWFH